MSVRRAEAIFEEDNKFNRKEPNAAKPQPMDEEEYSPQRRRVLSAAEGKGIFVNPFPLRALRASAVKFRGLFFTKILRKPPNFNYSNAKTQMP